MIAAIADVLRSCPGADFEIGGHTDSQGSAEANQRLSDKRAQAVLAALRAEDLPMVRLTARGFGASAPRADNASEAGRATNRRIEFTLLPPDGTDTEETGPPEVAPADPAEVEAYPGEACAAEIDAILAERSIQFAGGAATLAEESGPVIEEIGAALRGCPGTGFEIGGYTDSQGSESGNLRLSQERADAVLAALRAQGMALPGWVVRGYGEADPVADNATADGRAQNRRIAFTPLPGEAAAEGSVAEATWRSRGDGSAVAEDGDEAADTACVEAASAVVARTSIQFAPGSPDLAPEAAAVLDEVAAALRGCPDVAMEIAGHTDSEGSETGNERLSQRRAEAVLAALRTRGLALPQATARGYGESRPVADNATFEGRAQNRRIAFSAAVAEGDGANEGSGDEARRRRGERRWIAVS